MSVDVTLKIRQFIIYYARSLVHLSKRTTDQASDVPSIIFFHNFLQNSLQKSFKLFYYFLIIKIKSFKCPKIIRNYGKKILGTIRRLVGGSLGQMNQRTRVIYYKLTNF